MLANIKNGVLEPAANKILDLFEKACRVIEAHSQPLETLHIRPTLDELKSDWEGGQAALKTCRDA